MLLNDYRPAPDLLAGRTVLVTGAGDDLGRAAALACGRHGATVVLVGPDPKPLEHVYDALLAAGVPEPAALPFDLERSAPEQYAQLAALVTAELGRLDGLLHAALTPGTLTPLELYEPATWAEVLQVNLSARWLLTRALLPLLKQAPDASIVLTASDVGRRARAYWGAFGVAAFGNEALAQILADELATNTGVRVNTLDPGPVRSELRSRFYPGEDARALPRPDDIMGAFLYLLGPDSRGVSGRALAAQRDPLPPSA
jgi:NAD(P)-dependent dehydrogenase (short-subunit alcohol dehydrogenase family)